MRIPLAVTSALVLTLAASITSAHLVGGLVPVPWVSECADGLDNDGNGLTDTADFKCADLTDSSESLPGNQTRLERIELWLVGQYLPSFGCPGCGFSIVDVEALSQFPLSQLVGSVHPDWELSVQPTLDTPVPGIVDDPQVPNLRLRYRGAQALAPGGLGTVIDFAQPLLVDLADPVVGLALDVQSSGLLPNVASVEDLIIP